MPKAERIAESKNAPVLYGKGSYYSDRESGEWTQKWESMAAFEEWLEAEQGAKGVEFIKARGGTKGAQRYLLKRKYVCSRGYSGGKTKKENKTDRTIEKGSKKLPQGCPASIVVKTYKETPVVLGKYISNHSHDIGDSNISHSRLSPFVKDLIIALLRLKVEPARILETIRGWSASNPGTPDHLERHHLLTIGEIRRFQNIVKSETAERDNNANLSMLACIEKLNSTLLSSPSGPTVGNSPISNSNPPTLTQILSKWQRVRDPSLTTKSLREIELALDKILQEQEAVNRSPPKSTSIAPDTEPSAETFHEPSTRGEPNEPESPHLSVQPNTARTDAKSSVSSEGIEPSSKKTDLQHRRSKTPSQIDTSQTQPINNLSSHPPPSPLQHCLQDASYPRYPTSNPNYRPHATSYPRYPTSNSYYRPHAASYPPHYATSHPYHPNYATSPSHYPQYTASHSHYSHYPTSHSYYPYYSHYSASYPHYPPHVQPSQHTHSGVQQPIPPPSTRH